MEVCLNGIKNFLELINDNWTTIIVIIGLIVGIVQKVKKFLLQSDEDKIEVAKEQIRNSILKLITDAETDYQKWSKAGQIKRSQVIQKVYELYPILKKITDQEDLIAWIDELIDDSLVTLRDVIEANKFKD